jgi:predicted thioesterase
VWATTTVKEVDRRRVLFDIEVRDEKEIIATGTHERFIVDLEKFEARLGEKAASLG